MSLLGEDAMDAATALDPPILSMGFQAAPPPSIPIRKRRQRPRPDFVEARAWHAELVRLESMRPQYLSNQVQRAIQEQGLATLLLQKSLAETRAVESFVQHLWTAQKGLINELKAAFVSDGMDGGDDDVSVLTEYHAHEHSSVTSNAVTNAATTMHKSARLMVLKIYTLGVKQLQQVLERVRRFIKVMQEQRDVSERLELTAVQVLEETECQVLNAWDKYLNDASDWMEQEDDDSPTNSAQKTSLSRDGVPMVKTSIGNAPQKHVKVGRRRSSVSTRNNMGLRNMNKAAATTANIRDIWLSEWCYRAHVLEQENSCRDACGKLRQLGSTIQTNEVKRRLQLREDLVAITKSQQRLAVNLEAASTWSLMEYVEGQQQDLIEEEEEEDDIDEKTSHRSNNNGGPGTPDSTKPTFEFEPMSPHHIRRQHLVLPPLMESGFLTLVTVVRRKEMDGSRSTVSMLMVTTDGIMYFFDVPSDAALNDNLRKISVPQAYQTILKAAAKREFIGVGEQSDEDEKWERRVAPPTPSLRFVMAQCSVEMTNEDCVVQFCIPESLGKDFLIQLSSTRLEIGFIDNFHACKLFKEDSVTDLVTDNEAGGEDSSDGGLSSDDDDTSDNMDDDDDDGHSFSED